MKQIYVVSKSSGIVYKRILAYAGTDSGPLEKPNARVVLSRVQDLETLKIKYIAKCNLYKITKETNPEYFL